VKYEINKLYALPVIGQVLMLALFSLFILGIGYELSIADLITQVHSAHQQEWVLMKNYASIIDQQTELKHHSLSVPALKKMLSSTENTLIKESEFTALVDDILKLGANNSIKFQLVEPKEKVKRNNLVIVSINIAMTGTYDQIAHFMSQVANFSKVVMVGNFMMSSEIAETTQGNVAFQPLTIDTPLKTQLTLEVYEATV
jgi:type IV pilus assembly protein PilO